MPILWFVVTSRVDRLVRQAWFPYCLSQWARFWSDILVFLVIFPFTLGLVLSRETFVFGDVSRIIVPAMVTGVGVAVVPSFLA